MKKTQGMYFDVDYLLTQGTPLSEFRLGQTSFRLSDEPNGDGENPPACRDDAWQEMLRMVLGYVPEGAEHAPPCYCELRPLVEKYNFAGLAGLPSAVRLMDGFFPVRNQSKRGACFAFALVALCEYMLRKTVKLSEQSLFFFTKLTTHVDVDDLRDGVATLSDAVRAVSEYGICPLSEWHYNPESWNYVEDPHSMKQGSALERILALAKQYRFRNFEILPRGAVLEFKQALSSGRPVCIGVATTSEWHDADVVKTGKIPYPLRCQIWIRKPSLDMAVQYLKAEETEITGENILATQRAMIDDTLQSIKKFLFCGSMLIHGIQDKGAFIMYDVSAVDLSGGHAICLAGYVDDAEYPGGGYFIARNSWSDEECGSPWASESPEEQGYALLPYAYVADFCADGGVVMSDFPQTNAMSDRIAVGVASEDGFRMTGASGFDAWLASRRIRLTRPMCSSDGVLLPKGTPVIVPDPAKPTQIMRDTPKSLEELRTLYEHQVEEAIAKVVKDVIDSTFAADKFAVLSLAALKKKVRENDPDLVRIDEFDKRVRDTVVALQKSDRQKYWFGHGFGNAEEVRPCGKDSERIFD